MGRLIDLTGKKFGHWTVIERAENNKYKQVCWLVECDCENKTRKIVKGQDLREGNSTGCGDPSHRKTRLDDLTGRSFGNWKVLRRGKNSASGKVYWVCECSCDNHTIKEVEGTSLRAGHSQSCGCLKLETNRDKIIDMTGEQIGYLKVIKMAEEKRNNKISWLCKCTACNREDLIAIEGTRLRTGTVHSCGCQRSKSYGEAKIRQILKDNNINFIQEKTFEDCVNKHPLRFDFFIDNKYLLEYDGEQHFQSKNSGWDTEEHLKRTQINDNIKNEWSLKNNIPLIRIPYTALESLELKDLLLETTEYLIKG